LVLGVPKIENLNVLSIFRLVSSPRFGFPASSGRLVLYLVFVFIFVFVFVFCIGLCPYICM